MTLDGGLRPLGEDELSEPLRDLTTLACRGVPGCDSASVTVRLGGGVTTAAASNDVALAVDTAQYDSGHGPCVEALERGRAVGVDDYAVERRWPGVATVARSHGVRSSLSLPLRNGGGVLGALNMYSEQRASFDPPARHVAEVLARQAAAAVGYLELLRCERATRIAEGRIAQALQRSLLPALPEVPGVRCAARYLVGAADAQVGGDWYDVFEIPDGTLGLAMGDVMGHDVEAAAAMGQLRSVLRSYAYEGTSPSAVLDRLDRLVQGFDMTQIATAVYGRLVLDRDGAMLLFCNAGHLPPLVRLPDGRVRLLEGATSRLIGLSGPGLGPRTEAGVLLPSGSTLLLYSDGLVERRTESLTVGIERLVQAVASHPVGEPPEALCDHLVRTVVDGRHDDDVALLAVTID